MSGRGDVVVRFATTTPFYPLSMTYGMIYDSVTSLWYVSLDHYIGYHMLARPEHRRRIMNSPNGWIAYTNLQQILKQGSNLPGDPVLHEDWDERRDPVMLRGLMLKYGQNLAISDLLVSTKQRNIVDESRVEEDYWCNQEGRGVNRHGTMLERVRGLLQRNMPLEHLTSRDMEIAS